MYFSFLVFFLSFFFNFLHTFPLFLYNTSFTLSTISLFLSCLPSLSPYFLFSIHPFLFSSDVSFLPRPHLQVVGSLIKVEGLLSFVGNNAVDFEGGALYVSAFGQVTLYRGAELFFTENVGRCVLYTMIYNLLKFLFIIFFHYVYTINVWYIWECVKMKE